MATFLSNCRFEHYLDTLRPLSREMCTAIIPTPDILESIQHSLVGIEQAVAGAISVRVCTETRH